MNQKRKTVNPIRIAQRCISKHGGVTGCMMCKRGKKVGCPILPSRSGGTPQNPHRCRSRGRWLKVKVYVVHSESDGEESIDLVTLNKAGAIEYARDAGSTSPPESWVDHTNDPTWTDPNILWSYRDDGDYITVTVADININTDTILAKAIEKILNEPIITPATDLPIEASSVLQIFLDQKIFQMERIRTILSGQLPAEPVTPHAQALNEEEIHDIVEMIQGNIAAVMDDDSFSPSSVERERLRGNRLIERIGQQLR